MDGFDVTVKTGGMDAHDEHDDLPRVSASRAAVRRAAMEEAAAAFRAGRTEEEMEAEREAIRVFQEKMYDENGLPQ
jgi:hypothetical protein